MLTNIRLFQNLLKVALLLAVFNLDIGSAEAARKSYTTTLTRNFTGVASCNRSSRQNDEAKIAVNNYLSKRNLPSYSQGWQITDTWYKQESHPINGRRCRGKVTVRLNYYSVVKNFRICNRDNQVVKYSLSGKQLSVNPKKCMSHSGYHPNTVVVFDGDRRQGYQKVSYNLYDNGRYYFKREGTAIAFYKD